jgi:hypothetical protein
MIYCSGEISGPSPAKYRPAYDKVKVGLAIEQT